MLRDSPAGYRLVERTLTIYPPLSPGQHHQLLDLLGRPARTLGAGRRAVHIELADDPAAPAAVEFVRRERLAHDLTEQLRWTGPAG
jgi:hypothetical protein